MNVFSSIFVHSVGEKFELNSMTSSEHPYHYQIIGSFSDWVLCGNITGELHCDLSRWQVIRDTAGVSVDVALLFLAFGFRLGLCIGSS